MIIFLGLAFLKCYLFCNPAGSGSRPMRITGLKVCYRVSKILRMAGEFVSGCCHLPRGRGSLLYYLIKTLDSIVNLVSPGALL
ncbi:hypothetical protein MBAV_005765 [Candidatus Magnetobacterium bavaricum]|uniref:Uncharacterized protein n=1 Tax=Candidatus Magnetobacterium bavaricum TaxID=29290 RepID=A0A0F3GMX9_9BACT|nr:hypothetical protein MBAV_005765 [Candidatus Magnetobacterium bavaricum]